MDLLEGIIENKTNELWDLLFHVLYRITYRIPHDKVTGHSFK